jgi:GTP-binding protein
VHNGTIRKGQQVAWCRHDGSITKVKITELLMTDALERKPAESRPARATSSRSPAFRTSPSARPSPTRTTRPAAADHRRRAGHLDDDRHQHQPDGRPRAGAKVTARLVKDRLDRELIGNVSMRILPTERPDAWEVQGRGELALAILVEQMRREGYELTVGKPQVVTKRSTASSTSRSSA